MGAGDGALNQLTNMSITLRDLDRRLVPPGSGRVAEVPRFARNLGGGALEARHHAPPQPPRTRVGLTSRAASGARGSEIGKLGEPRSLGELGDLWDLGHSGFRSGMSDGPGRLT